MEVFDAAGNVIERTEVTVEVEEEEDDDENMESVHGDDSDLEDKDGEEEVENIVIKPDLLTSRKGKLLLIHSHGDYNPNLTCIFVCFDIYQDIGDSKPPREQKHLVEPTVLFPQTHTS